MSPEDVRRKLLQEATQLMASYGVSGVSMRSLAERAGLALSGIYHYFPDKDELLTAMYEHNNQQLGVARRALPAELNLRALLRQRIEFQIDHAAEVVSVLKYYMAYRPQFTAVQEGYIPPKAYRHIEEVLELGVQRGELGGLDIPRDAKVAAHAINGFLLEYFPDKPHGAERTMLVDSIESFLWRALTATPLT